MIAAAVAQVVVGGNHVQPQGSGLPVNLTNNQSGHNHLTINNQTEQRRSGTDVRNGGCDNRSIQVNSDLETLGVEYTPGFRSRSGSTYKINQTNVGPKDKYEGSGPVSTGRFISDGISQLTMGSFQVTFSPVVKN